MIHHNSCHVYSGNVELCPDFTMMSTLLRYNWIRSYDFTYLDFLILAQLYEGGAPILQVKKLKKQRN